MRNINDFRQGDVGIRKIETHNYKDLKEIKQKERVILAFGEVTGHHHSIPLKDNPDIKIYNTENPNILLLKVLNMASNLEHQEHSHITLEPGTYEIEIQKEYDPESEERLRRVMD